MILRFEMILARRYWFFVPLVLILSVQFRGDTSLIGIGYLAVLFAILLLYGSESFLRFLFFIYFFR